MGFVAVLYGFQQCQNFENPLRTDKATESLKVGTFLTHICLIQRRKISLDSRCPSRNNTATKLLQYKSGV